MTFDEAKPYIYTICNKWARRFRDLERDELVNEVWLTCDFSKFDSPRGSGMTRYIEYRIICYVRKLWGKPGSGRNNMRRRTHLLTGDIHRGFPGFDEIDSVEECDYLLSGLRPESRQILNMYYHDGLTQQMIGDRLGVSKSNICMRQKLILERLRKKAG